MWDNIYKIKVKYMTIEELNFYQSHRENYKIADNQFKCPICEKIFSVKAFSQHIRKEHYNKDNNIKNSGGYNGHYSDIIFKQKLSNAASKNNKNRHLINFGEFKNFKVKCANPACNNYIIVNVREKLLQNKKFYCSSKCAHQRKIIFTDEIKQKISTTIKNRANYLKENDPVEFARCFGPRCNNHRFTSQNERLIRDFIIQKFPLDGWTYGGHLVVDNLGISRDLYSNKLKICFEYDGIWHFKNIHDQLELKQKKDAALEKWCKNNNYRLIRISESWFIEDLKKDVNAIIPIIYNTTNQILKLGKEYT